MKMRNYTNTVMKPIALLNDFLMHQCDATVQRASGIKILNMVMGSITITNELGEHVWSGMGNPIGLFAFEAHSCVAITHDYARQDTTEPRMYIINSPYLPDIKFHVLPSHYHTLTLDAHQSTKFYFETTADLVNLVLQGNDAMIQRFYEFTERVRNNGFDGTDRSRKPEPIAGKVLPVLCDLECYLKSEEVSDKEACLKRLGNVLGNITLSVHHGHTVVYPVKSCLDVKAFDERYALELSENIFGHYHWVTNPTDSQVSKLRCSLMVHGFGTVIFDTYFPIQKRNCFGYSVVCPLRDMDELKLCNHVLGGQEATDKYAHYIQSIRV